MMSAILFRSYCVDPQDLFTHPPHEKLVANYTNPGYGLSLLDTLWNAGSYRQPLEQEGNPMT